MKSYRIFRHSIRQVFLNLKPALLASLPVCIGTALVLAVVVVTRPATQEAAVGLSLFETIVLGIAAACVAVNWHRFVLLEEAPTPLPRWHGARMLAYVGRSVQIALCMMPMVLILALIGYLAQGAPAFGLLILPMGILCAVFAMRLSVMLPAAALGRGIGPIEALTQTQGSTWTILLVLAMMALAQTVLLLALAPLVGAGLMVFVIAMQFVINWIVVMVTASVLTTLYGHYIEGRDLI